MNDCSCFSFHGSRVSPIDKADVIEVLTDGPQCELSQGGGGRRALPIAFDLAGPAVAGEAGAHP